MIPDHAVIPLETSPSVTSTHSALHTSVAKQPHILGVCNLVKVGSYGSGQGDALPVITANSYFNSPKEIINNSTASVVIIKEAKYGKLAYDEITKDVTYYPKDNYLGNDSFTVKVEGNGHAVEIRYFMYVTDGAGESMFENKNCKGAVWKISTATPAVNKSVDFLLLTVINLYSGYTPYVNHEHPHTFSFPFSMSDKTIT